VAHPPSTSVIPNQYIPPSLHPHSALICHRSYTMLATYSVVKHHVQHTQVFRYGTPCGVVYATFRIVVIPSSSGQKSTRRLSCVTLNMTSLRPFETSFSIFHSVRRNLQKRCVFSVMCCAKRNNYWPAERPINSLEGI